VRHAATSLQIAEAPKAAALKGVEVRIMISERGSGQVVPYWAAYRYMQEIAAAGARVLLYRGGCLHAKTLSIESEICSIGSANNRYSELQHQLRAKRSRL
jgi:cardiolipin synthase